MRLFGISFGRTDPAPVRKVMEEHRRGQPFCEACPTHEPVEIHHIIPVAVAPELSDVPSNLISLCHACHITHGHAGDASKPTPPVRRG